MELKTNVLEIFIEVRILRSTVLSFTVLTEKESSTALTTSHTSAAWNS